MNGFESRIRRRLDEAAPCCTLSGVTLYRPDRFGSGSPFGYEIDNLLHWQNGDDDRLVIIECKDSPIEIASTRGTIPPENQEWYSRTQDGRKNLKDQLFNQAESIWQNLCVPPTQRRRIDAIVVSSSFNTPRLKSVLFADQGLTLHLVSESQLIELLGSADKMAATLDTGKNGRFLRVAQSDLLRLARQSVIVPELGHPEIDQAMELIRRCRQTLDGRLFDFFEPRDRRWAINGSAGMGKSVLLAYTVTVISTGKTLRDVPRDKNDRTPQRVELVDHVDDRLKLPPVHQRKILVIGLKPRQLDVLRAQWEQFHNRFLHLAGNFLPDVKPHFQKWQTSLQLSDYNVICIDEAHDLSAADQERIAAWWHKDTSRYLTIACDHHQKLRLAGAEHEKWMLKGIPFAGCSTRLKRNYRSPTPVYCAALGLMFRWFAPAGPKVVPTTDELQKGFGFTVQSLDRRKGGVVDLTILNDAHPANHWRYTVSRFTHSDAAYSWLSSNTLTANDVLWVRFGEQDHNAIFDAEDIKKHYNYKDLNSLGSHNTIDAEIKGREFPVVVVEGLPTRIGTATGDADVWSLRRQLYLCASRATAFLFFVFDDVDHSPESSAIAAELEAMLAALSAPIDPGRASSKTWAFSFSLPETPVSMDVFLDDAEIGSSPDAAANGDGVSAGDLVQTLTAARHTPAQVAPAAADMLTAADQSEKALPEIKREVGVMAAKSIVAPTMAEQDAHELLPEPPPAHHKNVPRRLHEVAKIIGWEPRELLQYVNSQNSSYQIKSVSWTIDWMTAEALIKELSGKKPPQALAAQPTSSPEKVSSAVAAPAPPAPASALDPSKPTLLSEKDFQRKYGQIPGWRQVYRDQYLKSGEIPLYWRSLTKPGPSHPAPAQPKAPLPKPPSAPMLTVRQLAQHLGIKPFQVIAVLMPFKPNANPNDLLDRRLADLVCKKYEKPYPSQEQAVQLGAAPAAI